MLPTTFSAGPREVRLNTFGRVSCLSEEGGSPVIGGHGAVYYDGTPGTEYKAWGITLRLKPGCLDEAVKAQDVLSFFNHDENYLLGSKAAGTLALSLDAAGCQYRTTINEKDPQAMGVYAKVERKDCRGSSMMFYILDSEIEQKDGEIIEWITRIDPLIEMGPVVNPAMKAAHSIAFDRESGERYANRLRDAISAPETARALAQKQARARQIAMG